MSGFGKLLYFDEFSIDLRRCVVLRAGVEARLRPKAFDLLRCLAENPGRILSKNELIQRVWGTAHVTDDSLVQCIREVRHVLGDDAKELVRTVPRRGYLFSAQVSGLEAAEEHVQSAQDPVSYCRTSDGVRIAVSSRGQGMPIIRPPTWFNHLGYDWRVDFRSALYEVAASHCQLIRYDGRGSGLSDRFVEDISFEGFGRDLDAVAESFAGERYALLGISQGGAMSIAHAARHPDKVSKLVLNGSFSLGVTKRQSARDAETAEAYLTLMRHGWGDEHSAFLRSYGMLYFPSASSDDLKASAEVQRMAMSAEVAVRTRIASSTVDVLDLLPKISAPTLVLHSRYDNAVPFEEGLRLAEHIPNARFVALESENHCPVPSEPAWATFVKEISAFLSE